MGWAESTLGVGEGGLLPKSERGLITLNAIYQGQGWADWERAGSRCPCRRSDGQRVLHLPVGSFIVQFPAVGMIDNEQFTWASWCRKPRSR